MINKEKTTEPNLGPFSDIWDVTNRRCNFSSDISVCGSSFFLFLFLSSFLIIGTVGSVYLLPLFQVENEKY